MKYCLLGLVYAIGIILTETIAITAWYCSPLVINFDASPIVLGTIVALPIVAACVATRKKRSKPVETGIFLGCVLWCVMLVPICWTLPMLISKKLIISSLLIYLGLSVAGAMCSANIYNLQSRRKPKQNTEQT